MNPAEAGERLCLRIGGKPRFPFIRVADSFRLRGLGLMGRRRMPEEYGAGLFFPKCRSLHGCFMRFELEVWFLDADGQPVKGPCPLRPWRLVTGPRGARHCLEILPGSIPDPASGSWEWSAAGSSAKKMGEVPAMDP